MALTAEQKDQVIQLSEQGLSEREIAEALGVTHERGGVLSIYGALKQHRVRQGLEEPFGGKRSPGRPPKKKVRVQSEEVFEIATDATVGVLPQFSSAPGVSTSSTLPISGSPLFPRGNSPTAIHKIIVERVLARPQRAGVGVLGYLDPLADESTIQEAWGGGRYDLKAVNSVGQIVGRNTVTIAGESIPVSPEGLDGEVAFVQPTADPVMQELSDLRRQLVELSQNQVHAERERYELMMKREREMQSERDRNQQAFFQATQNQSNQFNQHMLAMVQAQSGRKSGVNEAIETYMMLRDFSGEGGSKNGESDFAAAARAIPQTIAAFAQLKGPANVTEETQGLPQQATPQLPQNFAPPHQGSPSQRPSAPPEARGDEGDEGEEPLELDEIGGELVYSLVEKYGMTEEAAEMIARQGMEAVQQVVMKPSNGKAPAQKKPPAPPKKQPTPNA